MSHTAKMHFGLLLTWLSLKCSDLNMHTDNITENSQPMRRQNLLYPTLFLCWCIQTCSDGIHVGMRSRSCRCDLWLQTIYRGPERAVDREDWEAEWGGEEEGERSAPRLTRRESIYSRHVSVTSVSEDRCLLHSTSASGWNSTSTSDGNSKSTSAARLIFWSAFSSTSGVIFDVIIPANRSHTPEYCG